MPLSKQGAWICYLSALVVGTLAWRLLPPLTCACVVAPCVLLALFSVSMLLAAYETDHWDGR